MRTSIVVRTALVAIALAASSAPAAEAGGEPKGDITWVRELDEARKIAAREGKPIMAYFTFET